MCDCKQVDDLRRELRAEQEDNLFLRKRRIELRKEIDALQEQVHELQYQREQLQKELDREIGLSADERDEDQHYQEIESRFPEGLFPPVV